MPVSAPRYRWLFAAAVIAGTAYCLVRYVVTDPATNIAFKALCVGLLAVWAALNARNRDGWLITGVLALGAIGDVVIEGVGLTAGALCFLAGHIVAIVLYLSHRRSKLSASQAGLAILLLIGIPLIAFLLPADRSAAPGVALYATGLGAMAASAWISRFPRYRVGIGAVLFAASDLLIFAQMGPLAGSAWGKLTLPFYFAGQALIAWGVVTILLHWKADEDLHHRL